MSLIVSFRLSSPELPLMGPLASVPDTRLEVEHEYAVAPEAPTVFAWAVGDDFATFECEAANDPSVAGVETLDATGERRLYRIEVSSDADTVMYPAGAEVGASQLSVVATHRGLDVEQRFTDRDALARYRELCRDRGVALSVRRIYREDGDAPGAAGYGLSTKQRTSLRRAVAQGYYAVPRHVELRELSADLGVSRQAASERLRRGVAGLVRNTIGAE